MALGYALSAPVPYGVPWPWAFVEGVCLLTRVTYLHARNSLANDPKRTRPDVSWPGVLCFAIEPSRHTYCSIPYRPCRIYDDAAG